MKKNGIRAVNVHYNNITQLKDPAVYDTRSDDVHPATLKDSFIFLITLSLHLSVILCLRTIPFGKKRMPTATAGNHVAGDHGLNGAGN